MKQGLVYENGELMYYKNSQPHHAGVIKVGGAIFYIGTGGKAVKGRHIVHREMSNNILKQGTYTFGEDYKLVKGSYKAPEKHHKQKSLLRLLGFNSQTTSMRRSPRKLQFSKKEIALTATALTLALVLITGVSFLEKAIHANTTPTAPSSSGTTQAAQPSSKVILPEFTDDVVLCSTAAKAEYDGKIPLTEAVQTGSPYRAFQFEYQLVGSSGRLLLGREPSLSDAREYFMPESDTVVNIHNLLTDTTYYYKVIVGDREYPGSFHTAKSTRFVNVYGLTNTRDIGGYVNQDGKTVRQGLLIRGVELDGLVNSAYFIPTENLPDVQADFGFNYDLDLRAPSIYTGNYTSRLGTPHYFYNAPMYGSIFDAAYKESVRLIFSDMSKRENYPMYLHCTWGADRTGTIIFLLQGILNMSEEDMVREYRLTAYVNKALAESTNMDPVIHGLQPYEGDTLQEKIVTYLTTVIGVTDSEIANIRDIFLEG